MKMEIRRPEQQQSDKIGFKIETVTGDEEGHYTVIKGSAQEAALPTQ